MRRWAPQRSLAAAAAIAAASCRGTMGREPAPAVRVSVDTTARASAAGDTAFPTMPAPRRRASGALIRVAVSAGSGPVRITANGRWTLLDEDGATRGIGGAGERWTLSARGSRLRAVREDDGWSTDVAPPATLRPLGEGSRMAIGAREYRGELIAHLAGGTITVVDRLSIEDYLRGVVPLEIGDRAPAERAAVEAQAIAARSYAYAHLAGAARFDVRATVDDQVYGGVGAERPLSDAAVAATEGQVLLYQGRLADAPYHSTCGGGTAEPNEVWTGEGGAPYLRRVSDRIPGSDRYYCDQSPRFHWTRTMSGAEVGSAVTRYLRGRGSSPVVGVARAMRVESRTGSGRVGTLVIESEDGRETSLRGNEIRYALRRPGGELLNSTYFSVERGEESATGHTFVLRGRGYGHGIGMCQWGAIGRARAGQDAATILRTYYPGTSVGLLP